MKHSGKFLTVDGPLSDGTPITQHSETGADNQLFRFHENKNNNGVQIIPKGNGSVSFQINGVNPTAGNILKLSSFDSYERAKNQTFYFIDNGYGYQFINVRYDYSDIATSDITSVSIFDLLSSDAQDYLVYDEGKDKGKYLEGLVLDIERGWHDDGVKVLQWNKHGADNQLFTIEPVN